MERRILIIGAKGMAGHMICNYFKKYSNFIIGELARGEQKSQYHYDVDVTKLEDLEASINDFRPTIILNCIGILNNDAENNPEKAIFINSFIPHFLAKNLAKTEGKLIHISTDCVFSGKKGSSYNEYDLKDGIGFYAQSKALGEVTYKNHLTIRTSIIGPEIKFNGIGLLHWFLRTDDKVVNGYSEALWGGVTTLQLAKSTLELIKNDNNNGILHLTNGKVISKYNLLLLFKEVFNTNIDIIPNANYKVDKSLISTKVLPEVINVPDYMQMLIELKNWMVNNSDLYKTYYPI